jgi:glutamyl-tRNA synthetase
MSDIVTRFAPSPTGELHIGGARTALFNWLYARHTGGKFILRIEDTDRERSTPEFTKAILDALRWLGLAWDEGPFHQTERFALYREAAERLLAEGKAYRCTCTTEELDRRREEMKAKGGKPRYDGRCRSLDPAEATGKPHVIRFKAPSEGTTVVEDLLRGAVVFRNEELDDLVLVRTDGTPTYNFVVVVDDADMGITHVLRGDDHLNNTPKQVQIYQALGRPVPRFGHFPLILGLEGGKMSKRDAETSVMRYEEMGYLPEAIVNFLARLGWGHGDQEIFTLDELVRHFSLEHVNLSASRFDINRLLHLNAHYIKTGNPERIASLLVPFLRKRGVEASPSPWLVAVVRTLQERARTLEEMAEGAVFFFREKETDPAAAAKFLTPESADLIEGVLSAFREIEPFTASAMEPALHPFVEKAGGKFVKVAQPLRVALTGGTVSPGIFEVMEILGKVEVIRRLEGALKRIRG